MPFGVIEGTAHTLVDPEHLAGASKVMMGILGDNQSGTGPNQGLEEGISTAAAHQNPILSFSRPNAPRHFQLAPAKYQE